MDTKESSQPNLKSTKYADLVAGIEISDVLLLKSHFDVHVLFSPQEKEVEFEISYEQVDKHVQDGYFVVEFPFSLEAKSSGSPLFEINARYAFVYKFTKQVEDTDDDVFKKHLSAFIARSAVVHATAFCRKHCLDLITSAGYPRYTLPLLKFNPSAKTESST